MKVRSSLAPPRPGSPASLASGMLASSGCALLTMSAATSSAAFDAWPAAAALPVSGNRMPIFTRSAARAGAVPAASDNVAAPVPARTDRRLNCFITHPPKFGYCLLARPPLRARRLPASLRAAPPRLKGRLPLLSIGRPFSRASSFSHALRCHDRHGTTEYARQGTPARRAVAEGQSAQGRIPRLPRLRDRRPQYDPAAASLCERGGDGRGPRAGGAKRKPVRVRRVDHRHDGRHVRDVSVHAGDQAGAIRPDLRGADLSVQAERPEPHDRRDRKSTRLNSSHVSESR